MTEWRIYLDELCRLMRPDEKRAFAEKVGVDAATINRWRRGFGWPTAPNLTRLLTALSSDESAKMRALMQHDQRTKSLLSKEGQHASAAEDVYNDQAVAPHIHLDTFFLKLLRLQRDSPDSFWQICGAVLRELLLLLETHPSQVGIKVVVTICMPPRDGKIRSLRGVVAMGTSPWRTDLHEQEFLVGIESLPGYVITTQRGYTIPDVSFSTLLPPPPREEYVRSAAAFPILQGSSSEVTIAGALVALCTQPEYFVRERMDILEIFADIVRLALYRNGFSFYPGSMIELGSLPEWQHSLKKEIAAELARRQKVSQPTSYATVEAEIWQQKEQELLQQETQETVAPNKR